MSLHIVIGGTGRKADSFSTVYAGKSGAEARAAAEACKEHAVLGFLHNPSVHFKNNPNAAPVAAEPVAVAVEEKPAEKPPEKALPKVPSHSFGKSHK